MKKIIFIFIKAYQNSLRLVLPRSCRFYPCCSNYFLQAVEKFGLVRGLLKTAWRIVRCNPFSKGGFDPV
ncbi:MAG: membrane protein insertion efficiency factor YidD [Candidatus Omnitrophota bacterium]|nr:membrane protein insertion efficiency factor YidD [Candidatus Omnitrophota bacterium]